MLEDLNEAKAADTELRNEIESLKRENERLAVELAQADTRRIELERSSELAEARIAELTKAADTVRRDAARIDQELTELRRQNGQLTQSVARAEATRKAALAEAEKARAEMTKELEAARDAAAQSEADLAGLYKELEAKDQELAAANSAREEVGAAERLRSEAARARDDLPAANTEIARLRTTNAEPEKETVSWRTSSTSAIGTARQSHVMMEEKIEEVNAALHLAPPAQAVPAPAELVAPQLKPADWLAVEPDTGAGLEPDAERYIVRSGETPSTIALPHDVGLSALAQANGMAKPYRAYAGQKLRIDGETPSTATVALGQDRGSVRPATREPPPLRGDFLWPVNGKVIGAFGPIDQWRRRDGIDIAARRGTPVLAAQDGIVAYAGDGIRGYGQMILLRHDQGYITTYAHNAALLVEVGDVVERGQVIAQVGDTGDATQNLLHFELRKGRTPIDPQTRLVHATTNLASTAASVSIE